jgi:hypothetical protein
LKIVWEETPRLKVSGSIKNEGTETAYNVTIHIRTWFSNGTGAIKIDYKLKLPETGIVATYPVNIEGNETFSAGLFGGYRSFDIPHDIWADWERNYVDTDCISTYVVTASWDD